MKVSEMLKAISEMPLGEERGLDELDALLHELTTEEKIKMKAMGEYITYTVNQHFES